LRGEEGEAEAPYVKQTEAVLKSDNKDSVYVELAKDASIFLTENDRGTKNSEPKLNKAKLTQAFFILNFHRG
jgi:translation initiation factor 3 subunit M